MKDKFPLARETGPEVDRHDQVALYGDVLNAPLALEFSSGARYIPVQCLFFRFQKERRKLCGSG